jgi:2-polyprenyl-3-methyl-5-hydroxy-6-metoxy-1,4-benzoquinol methylase
MPDHSVEAYYDATTEHYRQQYERDNLYNLKAPYPSNYFRLQMLVNSFTNKGIKRVIEVGVGEGTPLVNLGKIGFDIWGFDISKEMVKSAKERMKENGFDPEHIFWADIQDPLTYGHVLKNGLFDGLMAMGVMPHVENDDLILKNMATLIRPGGSVFIEFRNKLLSLFSFNRYTMDFILNDLLADVDEDVKKKVQTDLESRLRMDMPPERKTLKDGKAPGFDAILSKWWTCLNATISRISACSGTTTIRPCPTWRRKYPSFSAKKRLAWSMKPPNGGGFSCVRRS